MKACLEYLQVQPLLQIPQGKGAHRPGMSGALGRLVRPGRALDEPEERAADAVKPPGPLPEEPDTTEN